MSSLTYLFQNKIESLTTLLMNPREPIECTNTPKIKPPLLVLAVNLMLVGLGVLFLFELRVPGAIIALIASFIMTTSAHLKPKEEDKDVEDEICLQEASDVLKGAEKIDKLEKEK